MALLSLFKNRDCNKLVLEESNQETELRVDIASLTMTDFGNFYPKSFWDKSQFLVCTIVMCKKSEKK